GEVLAVGAEDLDAIALAVADEHAAVGGHRDTVREIGLARPGARHAPRALQGAGRRELVHTAVAVAVGHVEVAPGPDREVRRTVEGTGGARDGHVVLAVVAGVGRRIQRAERLQQLALRRELPDGVVTVVGGPHGAVGRDRDAVRAIGEVALAPRAQEAALLIVGDDRMVAAADQEDAILAVHGHARDVAVLEPLRQLLPALDDLVSHVDLLRDSTPGALQPRARSYTVRRSHAGRVAMRMLAAWLAVVALLVGAGAPPPVAAQPAGTLVVGLVAEPVNLDPAQVTDLNSNRVGRRIVETLVTFPEESTQIVPGLAESWTISKDGLHYTFKLRKGISFHDGTPLNAEAVKFSIERQINPAHPFNKLGKYPFANFFFGNVKAVEVVDPQTVEFILKEPRASFLAVLTAGAASVVSPTAVRKLGADYPLTPVGTGPFKYVSWDRGQRVVLEKNPNY